MDIYVTAACNELRRALEKFQEMQADPSTSMEDMAKMRGRISRLVDMLDLVEKQERLTGKQP
jgi:hypothetical protein